MSASKNSQPCVVLKFGGTSVSNKENWLSICQVLAERLKEEQRVVVVHSALSGVSSALENALLAAVEKKHASMLDKIKQSHLKLADDLDIDGESLLSGYFGELDNILQGISMVGEYSPRTQAKVMAMGELMATELSAAFLSRDESIGQHVSRLDARSLLRAQARHESVNDNEHFLSAACEFTPDPALIAESADWPRLVVTQGFIASDSEGQTVLLGRGGSDTSGAYFAAKLQASRYEIWTDVPGMFTANPRQISTARLIKHLAYDEAQEIATTGAKILHPRCILPVRQGHIPTAIFCTGRPDLDGTLISEGDEGGAQVKAISLRKNVVLLSLETVGMWRQVGFLADAFAQFKAVGLSIDLVSTSESNVTVSLDGSGQKINKQALDMLRQRLEKICQVRVLENCAAVSVVGRSIRTILHKIGPAFEVFHEHKVHLLSQAANDLNLTIVVDEDQADRLVQQLHNMFIDKASESTNFGKTWDAIFDAGDTPTDVEAAWWQAKSKPLLALCKDNSPAYVYNLAVVDNKIAELKALDGLDRVFYAIKANSHPEILKRVFHQGLGFECVSLAEVELVRKQFPNLEVDRLLFTPNFAERKEYQAVLAMGHFVTLDNSYPLKHWPEVFKGQSLLLRIDPGQGQGHHKHVKTAGNQSKFGIPIDEIDEVAQAANAIDCKIIGLHAHTGSGILTTGNWQNTALTLAKLAEKFPEVRYLDIGGGLGVPERSGQVALDLATVNTSLQEIRRAFPNYQLWLEPGRFLVAQCGVLLTQVNQIKGKGAYRYVGVNAGMNSLIRPALYGAYHEIANLSKLDEKATTYYDVVGPICETGDKLGIERLLPPTEEGDTIVIANAGAYGFVMASSYNQREPAQEMTVDWKY